MLYDFFKDIFSSVEFLATFFGVLIAFLLNYAYSFFRDNKTYKNLKKSIAAELENNLKRYEYDYSAISFETFKRINGHPIFSQKCTEKLEGDLWDVYGRLRVLKDKVEDYNRRGSLLHQDRDNEIKNFTEKYKSKLEQLIKDLKK
ncbi:hypothetical protein KKA15_07045 [Patescibacteria group bacterium]|nr:hypothetical protein [Patescibacteria group bacterium]